MEIKRLAIIKNPRAEPDDRTGKMVLAFDAHIGEHVAALLVLSLPELPEIPHIGYDVSRLAGKPCWVDASDNLIKFVDWWKE